MSFKRERPVKGHAKASQLDLSSDLDEATPKPSFCYCPFEPFRGGLPEVF